MRSGVTLDTKLTCSPPTKANRVQSPAGSLLIFASGNRAERCRRSAGFLGIFRFPRSCIPVLLHSHLISPSSALRTLLLRAVQISQLNEFGSRLTNVQANSEPATSPFQPYRLFASDPEPGSPFPTHPSRLQSFVRLARAPLGGGEDGGLAAGVGRGRRSLQSNYCQLSWRHQEQLYELRPGPAPPIFTPGRRSVGDPELSAWAQTNASGFLPRADPWDWPPLSLKMGTIMAGEPLILPPAVRLPSVIQLVHCRRRLHVLHIWCLCLLAGGRRRNEGGMGMALSVVLYPRHVLSGFLWPWVPLLIRSVVMRMV
ncbi:hypothetical protein PR048_003150 [Dryococelus australis]|uniref:Uncharacterized protein n=1 Tax=Dryococelus australis TaxID=614101 RepID=A0ABQ9IM71_9NEOP|nr:hypothetical protein PR048_003150 [Dryococelus australis]